MTPIILARKPIKGTVANNVLTHGTGALNIDGCKVECDASEVAEDDGIRVDMARGACHDGYDRPNATKFRTGKRNNRSGPFSAAGRWPANIIHDGSDEVLAVFPQTTSTVGKPRSGKNGDGWGLTSTGAEYDDSGSAARFFYCAKASKSDRDEGLDSMEAGRTSDRQKSDGVGGDNPRNRTNAPRLNHHPTVKPTTLMRWLVRLVTPPEGVVLDPFCGSGSTGKAAVLEGFDFIGIEKESQYAEIARARVEAATKVPVQGVLW